MKRGTVLIALAVIAIVGAIVYPSARATYVRNRAMRHLREADELAQQMTSPVGRQTLQSASDALSFALRRPEASSDEIGPYDAELVSVINRLRSSPPPETPVDVIPRYDRSAVAGQSFAARFAVRSTAPESFLVRVSADLSVGTWRSARVSQPVNHAIDATLGDVSLVFSIPPDVAGEGRLRVTVVYRLSATGEGQDLQASPQSPLPLVDVRAKQEMP